MTIKISEKKFEESIESTLLKDGYIKRNSSDFDNDNIIDSELFFKFIQDSQKEKWQKLQEMFGGGTETEVLRALNKAIESENLIHVIRKGFTISNLKLDCAYFKPLSQMNPDAQSLYDKNILSVTRQVRYGDENKSIDMLLCLNGLPIATAELKNPATGQTFEDAIKQYKEDRDPKFKLLEFKRGALVHFAIDPYEIHMTTRLQLDKTQFLPFNKGRDEGRGNPDNENGYNTSYLWENIWQKDTWLTIINDYIELQVIPQKYPLPNKEVLIFPRYHQFEAVEKLTNATKQNETGTNYLIQHSTGSGKSNTIAWLAYKLFSLHNNKDQRIYDGIIVLSDRVGIVNQLANTIHQFEQTSGTVKAVEDSKDLAKNLESQKKILITTQQKFPFVLEHLSKVKGKYFAVIIDEAHSSQTGDSATKVKQVLTTNLDEAEKEEAKIEDSQKDITDQIEKEMETRGHQKTLSYYALTATPKKKTLKLFGTKSSDTDYVPFHVYSMRQAIEEGFILDVLKNYTTYERYFKIVKTASEDKAVEGKKASRALLKYVDLHHLNLKNKAKIIVEHFREHTQPKIGGLGKAMVVGSSRLQALKYKQEIDEYIKEKGYQDINTLVAFSGSLKDETGITYTEQSINQTKTEWELREKFEQKEYNILIVAEKYQTGFDQPLLHTMYVDKKLHGIKAVQTLSRLNRISQGKTETFVVDFQNTIDEIFLAFKPYYERTLLVDKTDPTYMTNLYNLIMSLNIIHQSDLDKFAEIFFKPLSQQNDADHGRLYASINPILNRFEDADEKIQDEFKTKISLYIESYSFLTQVVPYDDTNLEKMFVVLKFLINENLIKNAGAGIPELRGDVSLQWYRLEKTHEGQIAIGKGGDLRLGDDYGAPKKPEVITSLSEVIKKINEVFGGNLSGADTVSIEEWLAMLKNDQLLREVAKANSFQDFYRIFEKRFLEVVITNDSNQSLVKRIYSEPAFQKELIIGASQLYHDWVKTNNLPPITPTDPARNRELFRNTIYKCKGFVHWLDMYLNLDGLNFMIDSFDKSSVKEIKLLSSLYDNEYSINEKLLEQFKAYKEEFAKSGISMEMKVVSTKEGHNRVAHDRYLLGKTEKFNVPSFTLVTKGRFAEIKKTENQIPFDEYWNDKDSLDLIKDWEKIKHLGTFDVTCSDCGIKTTVPFRPDGKRSIYCKECLQKHRKY